MGRIPVFLNTDCLLPAEENSFWKNHLVHAIKLREIPEKLLNFHSKVDDVIFTEIQYQSRSFWLKELTL